MHIRLMNKDDAEPVAEVLNHAIGTGVAHFGTIPTDADEVLGDWQRTHELYPWLIAQSDEGSFVGFAKASSWKSRKAYTWSVESGIYILEGAQGKGVGRLLYERLFALLTAQGYRIVLAGVSVPNPASERLHETMGMRVVGEISPAGYKLGRWVSVRLYQKILAPCDDSIVPGQIRAVDETWASIEHPETPQTQEQP